MAVIDTQYDELILKAVWCIVNKNNAFLYSVLKFYIERGYFSDKQIESINKTYDRYHEEKQHHVY